MAVKIRKASSKNPPILSHEFVIQNHADIVSCVAMLFVIGLMFQATQPLASIFIAMHHNHTIPGYETLYTSGWKDICAVFFYTIICIVIHAVIQEYILDKVSRKLHLSKTKHSKFNESGQHLAFYLVSVLWGLNVIWSENYLFHLSSLWEGYPHLIMTFMFKFFYIVQIAYWVHVYPELYFQKTKPEEMASKITLGSLYLVVISGAYLLNFTRLALCLLVLHYLVETVFHASRILYFADRAECAKRGFAIWNVLFVLTRLGSIVLSVLTLWYGLALEEGKSGTPGQVDLASGNFNTPTIRLGALLAVVLLQAWMMWNFITFHLKRMRERNVSTPSAPKKVKSAEKKPRKTKREDSKKSSEEDVSELPEADQNTKGLRARSAKAK